MRREPKQSAILGAAFLMATSSIGPGFLTQTTVFTSQLMASFGFVILISVLLDIIAQLNIWRILAVKEKRAQDIANDFLPGSGYVLALLIVMGGLAFNIGNIGGCGLGLQVLANVPVEYGVAISCMLALLIFWMKEFGQVMDRFTKWMGIVMILLTLYIAFASQPPLAEAAYRTFLPERIDIKAIVTLVGGTVGGYICFAGGHRLIDAGYTGVSALPQVSKSAVSGILITATMRVILFLAVLGVVGKGFIPTKDNPAASIFGAAAGEIGYRFFGMVMWCAAITSVVGAAYTSVSFLRSFHPWFNRNQRTLIAAFILISTIVFYFMKDPVTVLVTVGTLNGLILPLALGIMLLAIRQRPISGYQHKRWLHISGWVVVALMGYMSIATIMQWLQ